MTEKTNIIFLHIPKTAGQSVHHLLEFLFGKTAISPARVNEQLVFYSVPQLRDYQVFSGHLDWSMLDCIPAPRYVFTILRQPVDRILSFYFFLRREAQRTPREELKLPHNSGKYAALHSTCDEYFTAGPLGLRTFLDNHYHNFYAYYFAGRTFDARQKLLNPAHRPSGFSDEQVVRMALENFGSLDGVFTTDYLAPLEQILRKLANRPSGGPSLETLRVNRGDGEDMGTRMEKLRALGATAITFERIEEMTRLDKQIWQATRERIGS